MGKVRCWVPPLNTQYLSAKWRAMRLNPRFPVHTLLYVEYNVKLKKTTLSKHKKVQEKNRQKLEHYSRIREAKYGDTLNLVFPVRHKF